MAKIKIQGNASGTGVLTIEAPNTNVDRTITLPDVTGTLATEIGNLSDATTAGSSNVGLGSNTLQASTSGSSNTALGYNAGNNITTGSTNIIIGANVTAPSATASNQLNIGGWIKGEDGAITMPSQPVFDVAKGGASGTFTGTIVHSTTYVDIGGNHDTTNGRFTAPVNGTYYFYTTHIKNNSTTTSRRYFQKNGTTIHGDRQLRLDGGDLYGDNATLAATITLSAGDYITVYQGAGNSYGTTSYDYFGGHLIG